MCEHASTETLSLPVYPGMPLAHIERVCEVLISAVKVANEGRLVILTLAAHRQRPGICERISRLKAGEAVANIIFDYDGSNEFVSYHIVRPTGFVDAVFARNTPEPLYTEVVGKLRAHPTSRACSPGGPNGGPRSVRVSRSGINLFFIAPAEHSPSGPVSQIPLKQPVSTPVRNASAQTVVVSRDNLSSRKKILMR